MKGDKRTLHTREGMPALSAIIVSPGGYEGILPTLYDLADQSMVDQIEVLVPTPTPEAFEAEGDEYKKFHSFHVVDAGDFKDRGEGAAPGVLNARAPVVVLAENHAFPQPGWAEHILEAHKGPWTGVTPYIEIYNPETPWSRIASFMDYGHWITVDKSEESEIMPWHNASYKREALTALGDELYTLLEPENQLQDRLRAQGHRFYIERKAVTRHVGTSSAKIACLSAFGRGREFAIVRRENWSWPRRLLYAASWPVFPFIRLVKLVDQLRRYNHYYPVAPLIPGIVLLLISTAYGEFWGYLGGMGRSEQYLLLHELKFDYRINKKEFQKILGRIAGRRSFQGA